MSISGEHLISIQYEKQKGVISAPFTAPDPQSPISVFRQLADLDVVSRTKDQRRLVDSPTICPPKSLIIFVDDKFAIHAIRAQPFDIAVGIYETISKREAGSPGVI
jgi:hypothetical protein